MLKLICLLASGFLIAVSAQAETCSDFKSCAKLMYELKGQRYVWDAKMDDSKFIASPNIEMTKDSAELIFTGLLDQLGMARLPMGDGKTYRVERNVMLKEIEAPVLDASAEKAPVFLSNTWDWVTMRYKVKSPEAAPVIESTYRLHLPREARMQADENAGLLLVTGTIPMVRQMYQTLKAADFPLTATGRQHYKEWRASMLSQISSPAPAPSKAVPGVAKTK